MFLFVCRSFNLCVHSLIMFWKFCIVLFVDGHMLKMSIPMMHFFIKLLDINTSMIVVQSPIRILHFLTPIMCAFWPSAVSTLFLKCRSGPYSLLLILRTFLLTIVLLLPVSARNVTGKSFNSHSPVICCVCNCQCCVCVVNVWFVLLFTLISALFLVLQSNLFITTLVITYVGL